MVPHFSDCIRNGQLYYQFLHHYITPYMGLLGTIYSLISVFMIQWRLNHEGLDRLGLLYAQKR